jgi:hypothetical protein
MFIPLWKGGLGKDVDIMAVPLEVFLGADCQWLRQAALEIRSK